jgi:hypothetical protein
VKAYSFASSPDELRNAAFVHPVDLPRLVAACGGTEVREMEIGGFSLTIITNNFVSRDRLYVIDGQGNTHVFKLPGDRSRSDADRHGEAESEPGVGAQGRGYSAAAQHAAESEVSPKGCDMASHVSGPVRASGPTAACCPGSEESFE